jgi:aspartyl-tRNA(Asn)/glutamyl-tRNA(Gln) amidotransferase subunit B
MIEEQQALVGELPMQLRSRWTQQLGLSDSAANTLSQHPAVARFFEATHQLFDEPVKVANWIQTEVLRSAKLHGIEAEIPVTPAQVAELLQLVEDGKISGKQAKDLYAAIEGTERKPADVVKEQGLTVVSDETQLLPMCEELIAAHPKEADAVRGGKKGVLGFFVGQVMKRTNKQANPAVVSKLFAKLLAGND